MLVIVDAKSRPAERKTLYAMFAARKRVFVDILKWDVPVVAGRFEVDQFDDAHARYLIVLDDEGEHVASARLLPTVRPGILSSLYSDLSDHPLPADDHILEITRFCLSPDIHARARLVARNILVTALARYAIETGIDAYLAVTSAGWIDKVLAFGWSGRRLGDIRRYEHAQLGALRIDITPDVLDRLALAGVRDAPTPLTTSRAA
jgi:acyl-homoserine lactone synthase